MTRRGFFAGLFASLAAAIGLRAKTYNGVPPLKVDGPVGQTIWYFDNSVLPHGGPVKEMVYGNHKLEIRCVRLVQCGAMKHGRLYKLEVTGT